MKLLEILKRKKVELKKNLLKCLLIIVNCIFLFLFIYGLVISIKQEKRQSELLTNSFKAIELVKVRSSYIIHKNEDINEHNGALISVFTQRAASELSWIVVKEESIKQIRNIYSAIIAAILALLFSKQSNNVNKFYLMILIIILLMFALDVHQEDIFNRQRVKYALTQKTIEKIIYSHPGNIWWDSNYYDFEKMMDEITKGPIRYCRKLQLALEPNIERIIYYQIPWIAISLLIIGRSNKK